MHTTHRIASGRATLAVDVQGEGSPIVFLHAAVCDRRMWRGQLAPLAQHNMAMAYDRRGFGDTLASEDTFSCVADLNAVLDGLVPGQPAVLVGCSQGGRVALDAALAHPERVRGLVLISASVSGMPEAVYPVDIAPLMTRLQEAEAADDKDRINAIKAHLYLDGPRSAEGRVSGAARQLFLDMNGIALRSPPVGRNVDTAPAYDRLGEIAVPSLVLAGDLDFPHIQDRARHIAAAMPNARFQALNGVAHLPSIEPANTIAAQVKAFMATL
ncbi:alpha/beta fold hydrolase [Schauerella aestuarii]|uniref:alpha/beta fold hydrolase n=1 Tax=Schauerella aestuarii TaxID=2511204 RepID=UPI00136822B9|nr:alpha/beta hydrolase [Achromobacter aestuarii]MYZ44654.1 alpha/beta hydrolase [Achromobacter aestuarii]